MPQCVRSTLGKVIHLTLGDQAGLCGTVRYSGARGRADTGLLAELGERTLWG